MVQQKEISQKKNMQKENMQKEIREKEEQAKCMPDPNGWRLRFHLMPPAGWLNDPNGLCFYKGRYRFFFQYAPFDVNGGRKAWGAYTSEDLVHWTYEGVPLLPDSPWDRDGVYSGSAFTEDGLLELFYTGNVKHEGVHDYILSGRESNTIYTASQDGVHFGEKECLLQMEDYPETYTNHIRDPKVWKEGDCYYMVLGGRRKNDQGAVLLYRSADKRSWKLQREITTEAPFGYMWECPDAFSMGGQWILSASPQGLCREAYRYQNKDQAGYFFLPGGWKEEGCPKDFREWDMGFDFYAPQTFADPKGRRILVGWCGVPDTEGVYGNPTTADGWQHALTVPRELTLRDNTVYQYPVEELRQLRTDVLKWQKEGRGYALTVEDTCFDWEAAAGETEAFTVTIAEAVRFTYRDGVCTLAFQKEAGAGRTVRRALVKRVEHIRILADTSLLEIYLNGGEYVFTSRYYVKTKMRRLSAEGFFSPGTVWGIQGK